MTETELKTLNAPPASERLALPYTGVLVAESESGYMEVVEMITAGDNVREMAEADFTKRRNGFRSGVQQTMYPFFYHIVPLGDLAVTTETIVVDELGRG